MASMQQIEQQLQRLTDLQPEQARTTITTFPSQVVYEARYALQTLKEQVQQNPELVDVVEPIAIAIGWVEASAFFMDATKERDTLKSMTTQHPPFN